MSLERVPIMNDHLEQLIHDIHSKCASLKSAAGLLRQTKSKEAAQDLLELMLKQTQSLMQSITHCLHAKYYKPNFPNTG